MNRLATENYSSLVLEGEGAGKRALITGLHGFTGHYMAQELTAAGYRVFGIVLPGEPVGPDVYTVDLCDRDALMRAVGEIAPDVVVHLAGIAFVAHANAELIYRVNIVGTRNLLEALAASPVALSTMGRGLDADPAPFLAAAAAGAHAAACARPAISARP